MKRLPKSLALLAAAALVTAAAADASYATTRPASSTPPTTRPRAPAPAAHDAHTRDAPGAPAPAPAAPAPAAPDAHTHDTGTQATELRGVPYRSRTRSSSVLRRVQSTDTSVRGPPQPGNSPLEWYAGSGRRRSQGWAWYDQRPILQGRARRSG